MDEIEYIRRVTNLLIPLTVNQALTKRSKGDSTFIPPYPLIGVPYSGKNLYLKYL